MAKSKKRRLHVEDARYKHGQPSKDKPATVKKAVQPTIPFEAEERILLVGEGDFSFAKSIVEHHGCCDVTATCFDSEEELHAKYDPQGKENTQYLEEEGQEVLYNVDATTLDKNTTLRKASRFDRILFNFPHVGGKSKDVNRQVRFNQELLVKFFASAKTLLAPPGTIAVTLFEAEPYTLWNIKDLARHSELVVQRSFSFIADAYPGYSHARTLGNIEGGGGWKGENRAARSYVFEQKPVKIDREKGQSKKRRRDDSDSEAD